MVPGLVKDVSLAFGFDANAQNDAFGSKKRDVVGGLNFAFDVPAGFLNASVHAYKKWNRNGFNLGRTATPASTSCRSSRSSTTFRWPSRACP